MVWELGGDNEKWWLFAINMILKPVKRQMKKAAEPRNVCRFCLMGGFFRCSAPQ